MHKGKEENPSCFLALPLCQELEVQGCNHGETVLNVFLEYLEGMQLIEDRQPRTSQIRDP